MIPADGTRLRTICESRPWADLFAKAAWTNCLSSLTYFSEKCPWLDPDRRYPMNLNGILSGIAAEFLKQNQGSPEHGKWMAAAVPHSMKWCAWICATSAIVVFGST